MVHYLAKEGLKAIIKIFFESQSEITIFIFWANLDSFNRISSLHSCVSDIAHWYTHWYELYQDFLITDHLPCVGMIQKTEKNIKKKKKRCVGSVRRIFTENVTWVELMGNYAIFYWTHGSNNTLKIYTYIERDFHSDTFI